MFCIPFNHLYYTYLCSFQCFRYLKFILSSEGKNRRIFPNHSSTSMNPTPFTVFMETLGSATNFLRSFTRYTSRLREMQ